MSACANVHTELLYINLGINVNSVHTELLYINLGINVNSLRTELYINELI